MGKEDGEEGVKERKKWKRREEREERKLMKGTRECEREKDVWENRE